MLRLSWHLAGSSYYVLSIYQGRPFLTVPSQCGTYLSTYQGPIICLLYQIATGNSLYPADLLSKKQVLKSLVFQFSYYLIFIFIQTFRNIRNNNQTTMYLPISAYQSPAMELTDDTKCYIHKYYSILICNLKNIRSKNVVRGSTQNSFLNLVKSRNYKIQ